MKIRLIGGAAATLVAAGVLLTTTSGLPGRSQPDTDERRRYTLIGTTHAGRAVVDVEVRSSVGNNITLSKRRFPTPWRRTITVQPGEVVSISFDVQTYGTHAVGTAPWARCEILRNGTMVGGDVEVDQRKIVKSSKDARRQAHARCDINVG